MSLTYSFADSFGLYTTASTVSTPTPNQWDAIAQSIGTTYGRFGGVGWRQAAGSIAIKTLPATLTVGGMLFAFNPQANATGVIAQWTDSAGTVQGSLARNLDGSMSVYRGSSSANTIAGPTAAGVLPINSYLDVEWQYYPHPTAGTVDVWVAGVCVISASGLNTRGSAVVGSACSRFQLGDSTGATQSYFSDPYVYEAASRTGASGAGTPASCTFEHYGPKRFQIRTGNADGTGNVGTPTLVGGASLAAVTSDIPENGDTSYAADGTVNDVISLAHAALDAGTTGVSAIAVVACMRKDDTAARQVALGIRTSSTNAFASAVPTSATYAYTQAGFQVDGSGAALTPTGVNSTEILAKIAA